MRGHEDTYESTQMRAHRSTHMRPHEREPHVVRAGGVPGFRDPHFVWKFTGKTHMDMSQEPFCVEIYGKKTLMELHKSHFVWKFTGKMPPACLPTWIKHRASAPYRKNSFSVATLFGTN